MSIRSIVPTARSGSTGKIVSAREAVQLIRVGDTVALGGFFGIGLAVEVIHELAAVFQAADEESAALGKPRDLTLVFCVSPGDAQSGGANRLAQPGLVKRIIGGHWTGVPALYQLVAGNQIEGYNLPLGPMSQLYLDIAAGKPGHLSRVGLGTFADPRFSGGKLNEMTTEDLVEVMEIGGQEYLFYKAFPIDVAIIRGTTADPAGNITMEREALTCDTLALAMAAHSSGGLVIAQVERVAEVNTLNPRQVKIPGALVDCIVVATDPANHMQSWASPYNPAFSAEVRVPLTSLAPMPLSDRKIIARRAAMELRANSVVTASRPAAPRSARPPTRRRSSTCPISSTSTTAAVSTRRSSGWRRPTGKATSTYRGSARGWPARAASSTSARTRRRCCSSAPSPRATSSCPSWRASC